MCFACRSTERFNRNRFDSTRLRRQCAMSERCQSAHCQSEFLMKPTILHCTNKQLSWLVVDRRSSLFIKHDSELSMWNRAALRTYSVFDVFFGCQWNASSDARTLPWSSLCVCARERECVSAIDLRLDKQIKISKIENVFTQFECKRAHSQIGASRTRNDFKNILHFANAATKLSLEFIAWFVVRQHYADVAAIVAVALRRSKNEPQNSVTEYEMSSAILFATRAKWVFGFHSFFSVDGCFFIKFDN